MSEALSRVQEIVRLTQQAEVGCVGGAVPSKGVNMIDLDECPRAAAPTIGRDVRALTAVAGVHFSPNQRRHVSTAPFGIG